MQSVDPTGESTETDRGILVIHPVQRTMKAPHCSSSVKTYTTAGNDKRTDTLAFCEVELQILLKGGIRSSVMKVFVAGV